MSNMQGAACNGGTAIRLHRREDEFSVQFSIEARPRFWARVLLPLTCPLQFSDFLLGDMNDAEGAVALVAVLEALGKPNVHSIEFGSLGVAGSAEAMAQIRRLGLVTDAYIIAARRFIQSRTVFVERGKANLRIQFWEKG